MVLSPRLVVSEGVPRWCVGAAFLLTAASRFTPLMRAALAPGAHTPAVATFRVLDGADGPVLGSCTYDVSSVLELGAVRCCHVTWPRAEMLMVLRVRCRHVMPRGRARKC